MKYCQSCGMPMGQDQSKYGLEKDGTKSNDYCNFCYTNGEFTKNVTMEQMIQTVAPFITAFNSNVTRESVETMLREKLPTLKRWKDQ